jgi:hypothetical protein
MSLAGIPTALNSAAISSAIRGICPRPATVGISIAFSNKARVRACHAGSSCDGWVTGFGAADVAAETESSKAASTRI